MSHSIHTYPQSHSKSSVLSKGLLQTFLNIYRYEGISALYGGITPHLLRVVPNAAIMFCCYELTIHAFE